MTATKDIDIAQYNYPLPDDRIALHPLAERDRCKLLVRRHSGAIEDHIFNELPALLPPAAMLIYNNTRVINARLRFHKAATEAGEGALIEIFCLEPRLPRDYEQSFATTGSCSWLCFVGNSKKWKQGSLEMHLTIDGSPVTLSATRVAREGNASVVEFSIDSATGVTFAQVIEAAGEIPIPPYLNRSTEETDSTDYQTIFSHIQGSVAAPTAGLHFTPELLTSLDNTGIKRRELTLHVGAGTFQPVKSATIGEHTMHSEFISVPLNLIEEIAMKPASQPIIAVGTTSVRTLESLYHAGCMVARGLTPNEVPQWYPYSPDHPRLSINEAFTALALYTRDSGADTFVASTRIIIAPGYDYKVVDGMVTNFHQPQSTLLLLVSAFTGGDWEAMYRHALDNGYRFLSYGDACLLL